MYMSPFWPFKKKPRKSQLRKNDYTENIVEYERNISSKKDSKNKDNSHLTNKNFLDALKIIDQDSKNQ